jgi:hypothetical protein
VRRPAESSGCPVHRPGEAWWSTQLVTVPGHDSRVRHRHRRATRPATGHGCGRRRVLMSAGAGGVDCSPIGSFVLSKAATRHRVPVWCRNPCRNARVTSSGLSWYCTVRQVAKNRRPAGSGVTQARGRAGHPRSNRRRPDGASHHGRRRRLLVPAQPKPAPVRHRHSHRPVRTHRSPILTACRGQPTHRNRSPQGPRGLLVNHPAVAVLTVDPPT